MEWHWVDRTLADSPPNDVCRANGYIGWADSAVEGIHAYVVPMIFNHRVVIGSATGIADAFCYADAVKAIVALKAWDGLSEPDGWIKHPATGRYRPDADRTREYIQS